MNEGVDKFDDTDLRPHSSPPAPRRIERPTTGVRPHYTGQVVP